VRLITDDTGGVVGSSAFDAFGNRARTGTADSAFGFTGNWADPGTGLLYLRARDYDPATGQFLSVDPAVDATRQPYAYTGNNPLLLTDPTGLDAWDELGAFGLGALDSLTFGVSSAVLGALVPGYDCFVSAHAVAFTAGSVTATVVQAAVMVVATLGAGAGLAVGLVVLRTVAKSAVKTVAKAIEKAVVKSAERAAIRTAERTGVQSVERSAVRAAESCTVNSFTAGTPVLMADGTQKPIEDVDVGDQVLATDPESGVTAARPVVGLIRHDGQHIMVELTLEDGTVITATDRHPFWDATTGAFAHAIDLRAGEEVLIADGHTLAITGSRTAQESLTAYNLEIAGIHTYYAGSTPVLVHNSCPSSWANPSTLPKHFSDHGADFSAGSADEYAEMASQFFQRAGAEKLPTKIDADGVIRMYEPSSNTFGSFAANGGTKTFFKPTSPNYWANQLGVLQ
jgi:RHS repeat-associated protein